MAVFGNAGMPTCDTLETATIPFASNSAKKSEIRLRNWKYLDAVAWTLLNADRQFISGVKF
jgi:hypothetical protein